MNAETLVAVQPDLWRARLWHLAGIAPGEVASGPGFHTYRIYGFDCEFSGDHRPRGTGHPDWVEQWFAHRRQQAREQMLVDAWADPRPRPINHTPECTMWQHGRCACDSLSGEMR